MPKQVLCCGAGKGVAFGVVNLIVAPTMGAMQSGTAGFAKGAAQGIAFLSVWSTCSSSPCADCI